MGSYPPISPLSLVLPFPLIKPSRATFPHLVTTSQLSAEPAVELHVGRVGKSSRAPSLCPHPHLQTPASSPAFLAEKTDVAWLWSMLDVDSSLALLAQMGSVLYVTLSSLLDEKGHARDLQQPSHLDRVDVSIYPLASVVIPLLTIRDARGRPVLPVQAPAVQIPTAQEDDLAGHRHDGGVPSSPPMSLCQHSVHPPACTLQYDLIVR